MRAVSVEARRQECVDNGGQHYSALLFRLGSVSYLGLGPQAMARPRFNPSRCKPTTYGNANVTWTPIITCPADFPASLVRTSFVINFLLPAPHRLQGSLNKTKTSSAAVRTCRLPTYPSSRVQLDAHPAIRSHRRLRRRAPRRRPGPRRSTASPEHTSQAPPTSSDARRGTRAALHALRAYTSVIISSDR